MTETDNPLKALVRDFAPDFAAWLLDVEPAAVRQVQPLNVDLPASAVHSDTIFLVSLDPARVPPGPPEVLLHIEFQGERSERPMSWRMLEYLGKIAERELDWRGLERIPLCGAVLYVGDGAGLRDTGDYRIACPDGGVTLAWRYRVIRLWQMPAEELLGLGRPALLTLIGQTRIEDPARVVPQAVATIGQVADDQDRSRLFMAFTSLMRDEEVVKMAERLMEAMDQGLLMDTPFLRRIRTESETRGEARGEAKWRATELRQTILDILATRLEPSLAAYRRIEVRVAAINDIERLRSLVQAVVSAANTAEFERALGG